jgi:spermidine synthase
MTFEELDYRRTPLGELILRRRTELSLGVEVYEVKLGEAFLMSSLFTEGEVALARLALASLGDGPLDVVVGGLGLGYTARAVLEHRAVRSLLVVEALPDVIEWHCRGLVPLGRELRADARCEFLDGDFFALAASGKLDPRQPGRQFDAILLDVDHSPAHVLHPSHAELYTLDGLGRLAAQLRAGGVFALWSNDPPEPAFCAALAQVFDRTQARLVRFPNPLHGGESSNTVYLAHG